STNGSVTQTANGIIAGGNLGVSAATGILLDQGLNSISNTFAASDSTSGAVKFQDTATTLTIATVTADAPCFPAAVTGVTGPADVTICTNQTLVVAAPVTAGAANTVRLTSTVGSITQTAPGVISGASLGVRAI